MKEYNLFKKTAIRLLEKRKYIEAIKYVQCCAGLAYNFNHLMVDDDLESLLVKLTQSVVPNAEFVPIKDKYVFYDCFCMENKGLTQQYIRALMSKNIKFLYILESDATIKQSNSILSELNNYPEAEIFIVEKNSPINKIILLVELIHKYQPQRAFMHLTPWNVVGVCVFNAFPQIERYLINLTDHAFWLGKSCSNYILEFRNYGFNISLNYRNISKEKLLNQPYYPIRSDTPFLGFPIDTENKIICFSGSAYYKICGRDGKFFKLIKRIKEENENIVFFFAGSGNDSIVKKYIIENELQDTFILLGHRPDINKLMQNIDLYINTYPIGGGLMTQYAVCNKKAIASYSDKDLPLTFLENLLYVDDSLIFSRKEEEDFISEVNKLIRNKDYREKNIRNCQGSVPTFEEFNKSLFDNIENPRLEFSNSKPINFNYEALQKVYVEINDTNLRDINLLKFRTLGSSYFLRHPINATNSLLVLLLKGKIPTLLKKWFIQRVRKYRFFHN